jgi:hypothetical protein
VLHATAGQAPRQLREVELVGDEIALEFAAELAAENVITFCQLDEIELDVVRCRRLIVRQNEDG